MMGYFCPMLVKCGWCNPYCTEAIKAKTLAGLERDWWNYGKDSGTAVRNLEGTQDHPQAVRGTDWETIQSRKEV